MYIQNFQPTVKEEFVQKAIKQYEDSPKEFDEETLKILEKHATHYNIPFARQDLSSSVASIASQVGSGFLSGFTTFNIGEQPKNEWEAIARNVGHLAGFVGYVPSLPFKILRAHKLVNAAKALRGKSVPMIAATAVTKKTKEVLKAAGMARAGATADAIGFLQNKRLLDIVEGGFHLGVASAVGSWQGGIDEMMKSFVHGAETGAVFRGIGNLINKDMIGFGKKLEPSQLGAGGRPQWKKLTAGQQGDTAIKMMASSLYTGLPSTVRGETTPEQIYNYLLGAYFGYGEMPQETRMTSQYLAKMRKAAQKDPEINVTRDPELLPEWDNLTSREKELVRDATAKSFGLPSDTSALVYLLAKEQGISVEKAQAEMDAFEKKTKAEYNEFGESVYKDSKHLDGTLSSDNVNTDIGESVTREPITLKAVSFVEKNYSDTLKEIKNPTLKEQKKLNMASEIEKKWTDLTVKKEKNPSEDMVKWLEKKYKTGLNTEARDFWRQWGEQRLKGRPVMLAGVYQVYNPKTRSYDTETRLLNPELSDKVLVEPEKPLDTAWKESSQRVTGEENREPSYFIFDHFVKGEREYRGLEEWERAQIERAKYRAKRMTPEELAQYNAKDWRDVYKDLASEYMRTTEQMMWKQANENGYYYFGGRGDAERRYYVKFHPNTPSKRKTIDSAFDTLVDIIVGKSTTNKKDADALRVKIRGEFDADISEYIQTRVSRGKRDDIQISKEELELDYLKGFISNVLWEAELNFGGFGNLKEGMTKLHDMLGEGFINSAKNFNKRAQIWFNTGYRSNPEAITAADVIDGNYNYILYKDAPGEKLTKDSKAVDYTEITDGGIIVRDDILEMINRDQGLPHLDKNGKGIAGFNKSFIVSRDPVLGALLGKYAFHGAGPELSRAMRLNGDGLHMIIPESAAKQYGTRHFNAYGYKGGQLNLENNNIYQLPVENIYNIHSTKLNEHSILEQRIPKQLMSNLSPYAFSDIDPNTIENFFGRVARDRFLGLEFEGQSPEAVEYNIKMRQLIKSPANAALRLDLLDNLDKVGVPHLLEGLRTRGNEAFAVEAYKRIMRINMGLVDDMVATSELEKAEASEWESDFNEFTTITDRMLRSSSESIAVIHHKFARPYVEKVIQNYVVNQLTRPKMKNSLAGAMRPYDVWLQKRRDKYGNTSLLNNRDDIFFLDEGYKDLKITSRLFGGKTKTLGQFWKEYIDGKWNSNKTEVEELFRSVALRVPMDSLSGAHALNFKGFTGRVGYGVLLHPRAMRAMGGADLDGDKVHVFFGDEEYGMKKTWKNMFHEQKEEFYQKDGSIADPKDAAMKKLFIDTGKLPNGLDPSEASNSNFLQYSPSERLTISQAASSGRAMLSSAVTNKSILNGAYAALRQSKEGHIDVPFEKWGRFIFAPEYWYKKNYVMRIEPKKGKNSLNEMNKRARAGIAFSSDPMDEAGLRTRSDFFNAVSDAGFTFKVGLVKKGKFIEVKKEPLRPGKEYQKYWELNEFARRQGLVEVFSGINTALYGRNFQQGRKWSRAEIKQKLSQVELLPEEARNTLLPKVAEYLKDVDWHDNIFDRIDRNRLTELYDKYDILRSNYPELNEIFDRPEGVPVRMGEYIKRVTDRKFGILTDVGQEDLIFLRSNGSKEKIRGLFRGLKYYEKQIQRREQLLTGKKQSFKKSEAWLEQNRDGEEFRRELILDLINKGEDFITQDLTDMVSTSLVHDSFVRSGLTVEDFKVLVTKVENIKKENKMMQRRFQERDRRENFEDNPELAKFKDEVDDIIFETEKLTRANDQAVTDMQIMKLKEGRTPEVERVIDHLMLNSIYRGRLEMIEEQRTKVVANAHKVSPTMYEAQLRHLDSLRSKANGTGITKVGLNSKAVSGRAVKEHIDMFSKLFDRTINIPADSEQSRVKGELKDADKPQVIVDKDGNKVKGSWFETGKDKETDKYIDELSPFQGLHEGELSPRARGIYDTLMDHLNHYHNIVGTKFNGMMRSLFQKDMNAMNLEDFESLNRWFSDVRHGTWFQKIFHEAKSKLPRLRKWHYQMFPEAINKDLMKMEIKFLEKKGLFLDRMGNSITGKVLEPTHVLGEGQNWIHAGQELSTIASEEQKIKLQEELLPFVDALVDGRGLHELAVRFREMGILTKLNKDYKGQSVLGHFIGVYKDALRKAKKRFNYDKIKEKRYIVDLGEEGGGKVELTGEEVIGRINDTYTRWNKKVLSWMQGDPVFVTEFINKHFRVGREKQGQQKMVNEFVEMMREHYRTGDWQGVIEKFGIDGMRRISQQFMLSQIPQGIQYNELRKRINEMVVEPTGDLGVANYFPHLMFDRNISRKAMERAVEIVLNDKTRSPEDRKKDLQKIMFHSKQLTGDWVPNEDITTRWDALEEVAGEILQGKKARRQIINWFDSNAKVGNQYSRSNHVAGWNVEPEAYQQYQKAVIDNFYKHISQIMTRDVIHRWDKNFWMKNKGDKEALKLKDNWKRFFKLYAQQAMGNPSQIPDAYLNNPDMQIKGTPYAWWADSNVEKKINKIANKFGINKNQLPPALKELGGYDYQDIVRWGNMEAKYELASLLAHPKSAIANLYGGSVHTWMNVGATHFKNARSIDYLKTNVNREWKSLDDVYKWVQGLGIVEEFLMYEADINPQFRGKKWKDFMKDAVSRIKKDPDLEDTTLASLAKSHGITESLFNSAAWFMRRPERTLRRDAFMSHYLQAREKFGGAIKEFDHPFLVEMGKRGVKATQFLYSAPFRPMFAGTSLGKVMTRFQLWAWNSTRFRNDKVREAAMYGWKPGTQEMDRFQRMATADLFMLGMGNLFMYSLFENALPAPWNYFQDTSEMLLGDDKERERAFFGAYPAPFQPLQMVTPPIARLLPATFKSIVTDDYTRLSDYYIWTMFPFGRMARDVIGPGGVMENPARTVEKLTGLPYMQFARQATALRDEEMEGPRGLI